MLTQWVQGFCKYILEESSNERKNIMVSYMSDLMKDATDFSWQGAKAAHTVYFVKRSGVPSSGKTWTRLAESEGPMLKNMSWVWVTGLSHRIPQIGSHGFVGFSKQVFVHTHVIMKPMESYRGTFVVPDPALLTQGCYRPGLQ